MAVTTLQAIVVMRFATGLIRLAYLPLLTGFIVVFAAEAEVLAKRAIYCGIFLMAVSVALVLLSDLIAHFAISRSRR